MKNQKKEINISEFKAKALRLLAETDEQGVEYIITKRGNPIARIIPFKEKKHDLFGSMQGKMEIVEDIIYHDQSEDWETIN